MEYEEFLYLDNLRLEIKKKEMENEQLSNQINHLEKNRTIRGKKAPQFVITKAINHALEKIKNNKEKINQLQSELNSKLYELDSSGGFLTAKEFENIKHKDNDEKNKQLKLID